MKFTLSTLMKLNFSGIRKCSYGKLFLQKHFVKVKFFQLNFSYEKTILFKNGSTPFR